MILRKGAAAVVTKNLEISYLLDFYGDVLTEKQRDVMEQYYNDDLSLSEIADNFGITRQGVRDAIKRGEGTILELEDKVGFARRYRAVQEGIESLEQLARDINFYNNNNYAMSEDIHRAADEMLYIINRMSEA
jgi:uncharacterized protein